MAVFEVRTEPPEPEPRVVNLRSRVIFRPEPSPPAEGLGQIVRSVPLLVRSNP